MLLPQKILGSLEELTTPSDITSSVAQSAFVPLAGLSYASKLPLNLQNLPLEQFASTVYLFYYSRESMYASELP